MRLLSAEFRKLRRPLTLWSAVAVIALMGLFAWGSSKQAHQQLRFTRRSAFAVPSCHDLGLQPGPRCERQLDQYRRTADKGALSQAADVRASAQVLSAPGAGRIAAGMMASLMGVALLLLLAGGHVGQEWTGHTIKQVLVQEGRRWRVLAAKALTLWIVGVAIMLAAWIGLAALMPILDATYPLHVPVHGGSALAASLADVARATAALAVFAVLGVLCAVITRNTLGAFFLGVVFVFASVLLAGFRSVARLTLVYWVAGWMRFVHQPFSVQTHVWRTNFSPLPAPSVTAGVVGLIAFAALCVVGSWLRFERSDVTA